MEWREKRRKRSFFFSVQEMENGRKEKIFEGRIINKLTRSMIVFFSTGFLLMEGLNFDGAEWCKTYPFPLHWPALFLFLKERMGSEMIFIIALINY